MLVGIDQGTSGTTVVAFDEELNPVLQAQRRLVPSAPREGWCEHDPYALERAVIDSVAEVLEQTRVPIAACGFANQGESVLGWDSQTLEPLTKIIVWNDLRAEPLAQLPPSHLAKRTGLRASSYFCAPKYAWLLRNDPAVQHAARTNCLALGTTETWLLARLGIAPRTDDSTASRTLLYDLERRSWDSEIAKAFEIPLNALASIVPSVAAHGTLQHPSWPRSLPLHASLVDQPAALAGHELFEAGGTKITYGTGAFVVVNIGTDPNVRAAGLLTSVAWSDERAVTYAIDGGVFSAGSAIDWATENGVAKNPEHLARLALHGESSRDLFFVPALSGLGAPWWNRDARAHFIGNRDGASKAELARAILDGIALRVADIVRAVENAGIAIAPPIRVDGGLTSSEYIVQRQADLLGLPLEIAPYAEATARGAALLGALGSGLQRARVSAVRGRIVQPRLDARERERLYALWLTHLLA